MKKTNRRVPAWVAAACIAIWILIWYVAAFLIDSDIFLPSPQKVIKTLFFLAKTTDFWKSVGYSMLRILAGYLIGMLLGIVFAAAASLHPYAEAFFNVPIKVIRSIPVASFVILILLWVRASGLSVLICVLVVLPLIYQSVLAGIHGTDPKLTEMATVYRIGRWKKMRYIQIPSVVPYLIPQASVAAGFAWKSGIAAEIIGLVRNSVGNHLYQAKLYLSTPELFAWTVSIILASVLFEKVMVLLLTACGKALGGVIYDSHR